MTIGDRIKKLRDAKGWTQEELAKQVGYKSRTSIARIEKDIIELTPAQISQFAEVLGASREYIAGWADEEPTAESLEVHEMARQFSKLSSEDKETIKALLQRFGK